MSTNSVMKIIRIAVTALMAVFVLAFAAQGEKSDGNEEITGQVVAHLIREVATSNLTFIRNGERHSSEEAAKHLLRKYEYFKSRIESPEDFIRLCASKSLVSGEPYLVVTPQGTVTVESWLGEILAKYRLGRDSEDRESRLMDQWVELNNVSFSSVQSLQPQTGLGRHSIHLQPFRRT